MWTAELTVEFVSLPPEKEEAYWQTIEYFLEFFILVIEEESLAEMNITRIEDQIPVPD